MTVFDNKGVQLFFYLHFFVNLFLSFNEKYGNLCQNHLKPPVKTSNRSEKGQELHSQLKV